MSNDSSISSNNFEERPSRKGVKEDFWSRKKKLENPFGGGKTKQRRNHHTFYLKTDARCPNETVVIDGSLLEF